MELLYAAGFNAWNQLHFGDVPAQHEEPDDVTSFTCVLQETEVSRLRSFLSYTVVDTPGGLRSAGLVPSDHARLRDRDEAAYSRFVEASNGSVVTFDESNIYQYSSLAGLLDDTDKITFQGFSGIVQIAAYETGFAALTSNGQVWTWGDERYASCLGRVVDSESPAEKPGIVSELHDLPTGPISKIAAGGYLLAALTSGNDLYCWGGHPGRPPVMPDVSAWPNPVVIGDHDIVDVAIGDSHVLVLTASADVYVIGDNGNGQLGANTRSISSWEKVDLHLAEGQRAVRVGAGAKTSFITAQKMKD